MKTQKNFYWEAYNIIKKHGRGSFMAVADFLEKSPPQVTQEMKNQNIQFQTKVEYTNAINTIFELDYSREDLFPTNL